MPTWRVREPIIIVGSPCVRMLGVDCVRTKAEQPIPLTVFLDVMSDEIQYDSAGPSVP